MAARGLGREARLVRLAIELRIVDRNRGEAGNLLGEVQIGIAVRPFRFGGYQRQCAERPSSCLERYGHR